MRVLRLLQPLRAPVHRDCTSTGVQGPAVQHLEYCALRIELGEQWNQIGVVDTWVKIPKSGTALREYLHSTRYE
jgi:hypothetical protein